MLEEQQNTFLNNEKKTRSGALTKPLNLREVFLLDNQLNVDLAYNRKLVEDIHKVKIRCKIGGTGGTLRVMHKASQKGYNHKFWSDEKEIANIYTLCNVIEQYRVSYDSAKSTLVWVHRKERNGMPDVEFKKHPSGLHCWDPRESKTGNVFASLEMEEYIPDGNIFVNSVQENMTSILL